MTRLGEVDQNPPGLVGLVGLYVDEMIKGSSYTIINIYIGIIS